MNNDLQQLVGEVSELTGAPPPDLMTGDSPVLQVETHSSFYLVGLIGGKEVGKTALVNALAGESLSTPTSFGRGTEIAIAYAHSSQVPALQELFAREAPGQFKIVPHQLPHLQRQVLLDLPDIDSRYEEHVQLTKRMLRHMLFPIWIQSIEKYADQQPQKLLAAVAQGNDPSNFLFALNKSDQLDPASHEEIRADYAQRLARVLKLPSAPRVFLISAIHPDRFELPELREKLAREKSSQDVNRSLQLAAHQQERSLLTWLDSQNLPARAQRLARLETEAQELTASRLAEPLMDDVIPQILDDSGHRLAMTDEILARRMSRWPLVNLVHTLLSPLLGIYRASAAPGAITASSLVETHLRETHPAISDSIQATFATLHRSHPMVADLYRTRKLWEQIPADAAANALSHSLSAAVTRQRAQALDRLAGHGLVFAPIRWLLTIGALLWFPFIQPALEVFLQQGLVGLTTGTALFIVQLLSAAYLLRSAGFLLIWFLFLWAYLRWDTGRRVARLLSRSRRAAARNNDPSLNLATTTLTWLDDLLDPIRQAREQTNSIIQRTEKLRPKATSAAA
jgi:GTPase Era involved in 16S rRNA processing